MMYFEDEKYRIQADMALRIGQIALQYARIPLPPRQKFADTLNLCLLQNLVTHCQTLLESMGNSNEPDLELHVPLSGKSDWGLNKITIEEDSFEGSVTVAGFLSHLRNAMCHPTGPNLKVKFPSTGYYGIPDDVKLPISERKIVAFGFCDSPDTENNRPRTWSKEKDAKEYAEKMRCAVQIRTDHRNRFGIFRAGHPFARVFLAIVTTEQLHQLVLNLSNLLAQPAREYWDGKSVVNMLPAA